MEHGSNSELCIRTEQVSKAFGGLKALDDVSVVIEPGRVTGMIGPNGAGKTTLFNVITGFLGASHGKVYINGRDVTRTSPYKIARCGVTRTFQSPRVFPTLSVVDNIIMGRYPIAGEGLFNAVFLRRKVAQEEKANRLEVLRMLEAIDMADIAEKTADVLGYAQRKAMEILRGVLAGSDFFLLDEPFSGMHGGAIEGMKSLIGRIVADGKAVFLIEHNVPVLMDLSDYVYVLDHGCLIAQGLPDEVRANEQVIKAYLGEECSDGTA